MQKQKLTGWLIFFIVWIGVTGVNGLGATGTTDRIWRPYMADCPSLQGAVMAFQLLTAAGIVAWLYTVWVIYQREPGTLRTAQISLLVGAALRIAGGWSILLFGGLPQTTLHRLMPQVTFGTCVLLLFTGIWYFYLLRSNRVREIYAA
jgi:hypothetical protein